jgi:DNA replication and repair protein RecF
VNSHHHGLWIERIALTNFRNHVSRVIEAGPEPVVLVGPNGAGKTNILEAVSLLAPGQGLRRAVYSDLARTGGVGPASSGGAGPGSSSGAVQTSSGGDGSWAVAARVHSLQGPIDIGTGIPPSSSEAKPSSARILRLDGQTQSGTGILADLVEMVWLTPAMDGLFTGPAGERRRFLDRLILCFDGGYRTIAGRFERAMQSRNRLLADGVRDPARFAAFERIMAETGVAIAAVRSQAADAMAGIIASRRARDPGSPFPWATIAIEGALETQLATEPAVAVEDAYMRTLGQSRDRDRAAGRTLDGPHRSDLVVAHGPKQIAARLCSTGEQKALLLGLVLAHAELVATRQNGIPPILLLDEITAHLDEHRRAAMFAEILRLKAQAWMTGTDESSFKSLTGYARFYRIGGDD